MCICHDQSRSFADKLTRRLSDYLLNWSRMADNFPLKRSIYSNRSDSYSVKRALQKKQGCVVQGIIESEIELQSAPFQHISTLKLVLNGRSEAFHKYYSLCGIYVSLNSRSTKLVNCGVDRELSDISVVLRDIRVTHFIKVLSFLGVIYKTLFVRNI